MMTAYQEPKAPPEKVSSFKIEVGDEKVYVSFGRPLPHAEVMERVRKVLDGFDRHD